MAEVNLKTTMTELVAGVLIVIIGAVLGGITGTIGSFIQVVLTGSLTVNGNQISGPDYLTPIGSMIGSVFLIVGVLLIIHAAAKMIESLLDVYNTFASMG